MSRNAFFSLVGAGALAMAACGGEAAQDEFSPAEEAAMIESEIAELKAVMADLPPEAQAEIAREIASLRSEAAALRGEAAQAPAEPPAGSRTASDLSDGPQSAAPDMTRHAAAKNAEKGSGRKGLPEGAHRVKPFNMMDRTGFEKPLVAGTILAPADWSEEGGVVWGGNQGCNSAGYNFSFRVKSADGRSSVMILPTDAWQWMEGMPAPQGGCRAASYGSVEAYIRGMVPQANAEARIVEYRQRQDLIGELRPLESNTPMPGGGMRTRVDAGEAIIAYQENGVEVREAIVVAATFSESWMDPAYGMAGYRTGYGATMPAWSYKAPAKDFDLEFGEMMRRSYRAGPEWSARINKHQAAINKTNLETSRKISEINRKTNAEISAMRQDSWEKQQASSDRMARETSETIRGVETYDDPYAAGGSVELDYTYDQAWRLNDGTYVLTNDANFQPYRDLGVDGQQLSPSE
ncbi:MAG: hypothetical protein GC152_05230 [Alphaproteobacteria bacterium]|nr:hypothetical protein [Alphaproteobacteria bacterium]